MDSSAHVMAFFSKTRVNLRDQILDLIKIYCKIANSDSNHLKSNEFETSVIKFKSVNSKSNGAY